MATRSSFWPQDIIEDILSRLPVKSLIRFKSLSKHWFSRITNPSFITTHLRHSTLNPNVLIVGDPIKSDVHDFGISLISNDLTTLHDVHIPTMNDFHSRRGARLYILSSCNGLICAEIFALGCIPTLVLWNPATREFREIPTSKVTKWPSGKDCLCYAYGFGFNRDINDYKLVRILFFFDEEFPELRTEIFTWSTGSWREIDAGLVLCRFYHDSVTVKGFLYWHVMGVGELASKEFIVSFDMVTEEFSRISFPGSDQKDHKICRHITVFKDRLALFVYPGRENLSDTFELWTMNEYNGGDAGRQIWSKLYNLGPSPIITISCPVGLWKDCRVIMKIKDEVVIKINDQIDNNLFLYDLNSQDMSPLPTHGTEYFYNALNYVESMVSVTNVVEDAHTSE